MSYRDWIIALYDQYYGMVKQRKTKKRKKFKDISLSGKVKLISVISILLSGLCVYYYGILNNKTEFIFSGMGIFCTLVIFMNYTTNINIEIYEKEIQTLKELLKERGLFNENTIKRIEKDTQGILGKIKDEGIQNIIKIICSILGTIGVTVLFDKMNGKVAKITIILIMLVIIILVLLYISLLILPNSKMNKRKELNQLLKILMVYEGYK